MWYQVYSKLIHLMYILNIYCQICFYFFYNECRTLFQEFISKLIDPFNLSEALAMFWIYKGKTVLNEDEEIEFQLPD